MGLIATVVLGLSFVLYRASSITKPTPKWA